MAKRSRSRAGKPSNKKQGKRQVVQHRVRGPVKETPLKLARQRSTLNQTKMAQVLDISQQTYSKYEKGSLEPDAAMQQRIANILHTEPRRLWPTPPRRLVPRKKNGTGARA
jgi:DNA-binding XRE family transcriptional regulator